MSDRPLEDYSLPYLWKRIAELEAKLKLIGPAVEMADHIVELRTKLERYENALRSIVGQTDDQMVDGIWREVNTTAEQALNPEAEELSDE